MSSFRPRLAAWWSNHWFLPVLVALLGAGLSIGLVLEARWHRPLFGLVDPGVTTGLILFLMAWSLDTRRLRDSLRAPLPVMLGTTINIGLIPCLAWPVSLFPWPEDFRLGLLITAAVPCTLATASVWTRKAGGNDAVSLLVTLVTNLACVVVTPFWLSWTVSRDAALDPLPIVRNLSLAVLLPTLLGQLARRPAWGHRLALGYSRQISLAAQLLVLTMITAAAVRGGEALRAQSHWPTVLMGLCLALACAGLHVAGMLAASGAGTLLRLSRADRIAMLFAGSQKTLPVALLLAADPSLVGGGIYPFITFPMLTFHALQLVIDSAVVQRIAAQPLESGESSSGSRL